MTTKKRRFTLLPPPKLNPRSVAVGREMVPNLILPSLPSPPLTCPSFSLAGMFLRLVLSRLDIVQEQYSCQK